MRKPESLQIIPEDEIISYLSDEVELGETVTLERIFDIIIENQEDIQKIFHSALGGYSLMPFINELDELPTEKSNLLHLEVHWHSDKMDDDITIISSFHGIGIEDSDNGIHQKGDTIAYAIEFTPLNNLKYLPVKLNKEVVIMNYDRTDEENFQIELGNKSFTLFDLFYAILYEISFNGDPTGRTKRVEELEESVKVAEEEIEKGETHSLEDLEDFFEEMDRKDIFLVKYKELRDRVDEDLLDNKDNLEALKNCLLDKLRIYDEIENSDGDLKHFYKKLTDIEFNMQTLYGLDEDIKYHKFWETPKCTCPKIDNIAIYPKGDYSFDKNCPIHGN